MTHPDDSVFEREETIEAWDKDYYHPIAERYYDQAVRTMLSLMGAESGAKVLDAGCGPGVHTIRVARMGHPVCAVDLSQTMLEEAKARVEAAGLTSSVEFRREDLTRLSFPHSSFRYVFSWGVIIHIHEVEKALDELSRIVAPGGKLALYVTNRYSLDGVLEGMLRFLLRKPLVGRRSLPLGDGVWYEMNGQKLWLWRFDVAELTRQLATRGLHRTHRVIGEFSEIQRRVGGPLRRALLRLNNLCYRLRIPAGLAMTNLLIFEKSDRSGG